MLQLIGIITLFALATAADAWTAIWGYQAGGFWGAFWALALLNLGVALIKTIWENV